MESTSRTVPPITKISLRGPPIKGNKTKQKKKKKKTTHTHTHTHTQKNKKQNKTKQNKQQKKTYTCLQSEHWQHVTQEQTLSVLKLS